MSCSTLYDPGGGGVALKAAPPPKFCPHAFSFGATLLCVGEFSPKNSLTLSSEKKNLGGSQHLSVREGGGSQNVKLT